MKHSPEPWTVEQNDDHYLLIKDCCGNYVYNPEDPHLEDCDILRIAAAVNFCRNLPIKLIEDLYANNITADTLIRWVYNNHTYTEDCGPDGRFECCTECNRSCNSHTENCTIGKLLGILDDYTETP